MKEQPLVEVRYATGDLIVWCGGLEGAGNIAVDVFFDHGVIQIGVHDGEKGAVLNITPAHALYVAGLLQRAAHSRQICYHRANAVK